jgi:hypothetical protein
MAGLQRGYHVRTLGYFFGKWEMKSDLRGGDRWAVRLGESIKGSIFLIDAEGGDFAHAVIRRVY